MSTTDEEKRLRNIQKKILEFSAKSRLSSGIEEISVCVLCVLSYLSLTYLIEVSFVGLINLTCDEGRH